MKQIIECVPNFSEGRDKAVIDAITAEIEKLGDVKLLDVDPGEATNRTVVTFVGEPEPVMNAAVRAAKKAAELIDMRHHHGAHPRMGATDVCPLIPVSGITLEETADLARKLAERFATELNIPTYCYEASAFTPERKNLAVCREGEYEGLSERMGTDKGPDFGNRPFDEGVARTGTTAVGARDFLIAVNFNLNTTSTRRANAIAFDVREKGRPAREGGKLTGKPLKDENGNPIMIHGTLKGTKAIGWFIDEYGIAQVSMNITSMAQTPLHEAFDEVSRAAAARGIRVTGTEIVGLLPKKALIDAGKHYLRKQQRSLGLPESEIIKIAIKSMGLDELKPFVANEKVIEYMLENENKSKKLVDMTCVEFADETASESPAPGGGSISAYMGALAAALGSMVANLSAHKAGWDDRWEEFSDIAEKGREIQDRLIHLVDEDTEAFNRIMAVFAMPKKSDAEKAARSAALQDATLYATQVPLRTMKAAYETFDVLEAVATKGNPASVSDAGVGALAARAAVLGAHLNVRINAAGLKDHEKADALLGEAAEIAAKSCEREAAILKIVNEVIDK
ncbi:MAG: glutamate formimidoyltransferase [Prevotella sp.]|nr:glutamate formimidoyltransferase [Prevotella sp.]MCM1075112.1 glutamate formimidoyltransferase [Ruminococcus sp.]